MKTTHLDDCYWNNDELCVFWVKQDRFDEENPMGQAGSKYINQKEQKEDIIFIRDVYKFKDAIRFKKHMKKENLRWV